MNWVVLIAATLLVVQLAVSSPADDKYNVRKIKKDIKEIDCSTLSSSIVDEIRAHQENVDEIIEYVVNGEHKGNTFTDLQQFVDIFGTRQAGSDALESSIDWLVNIAKEEGFDSVTTEDVQVPKWVRNSESATMTEPRVQKLNILGLGTSVGTPPGGITAEVVAVASYEELEAIKDQVTGKIVVYDQPYHSYGQSVDYRFSGAQEAAKLGAVAALIRSVTDLSIGSPHTGMQSYAHNITKIPVACISVENAQMIYRLSKLGKAITIHLEMGAENLPPVTSRNTIVDYHGYERPEDLVVVSGHIDSWDAGTGTMDDGGGSFVSYHANLVLKRLGLRPRRTVRTIWWTGEEEGCYGGSEYFKRHRNESERYQVLMESDLGTFTPYGIGFSGSDTAICIMQEIAKLTASINTTEVIVSSDGPDIGHWETIGVPIGSLYADISRYFWFHHSEGDSSEVYDSGTLDIVTALWASVAYVVADIYDNLQDV